MSALELPITFSPSTPATSPSSFGASSPSSSLLRSLLSPVWMVRWRKRLQKHYRELTNQYGTPTPLSISLALAVCFLFLFVVITSHAFGGYSVDFQQDNYRMERKVSIIVPTYKEVENIPTLAQRVFHVCARNNLEAEMIIVDDNSQDGTVEEVQRLAQLYHIRVHVREHERGLSSAVLKGMELAAHPIFLVMDADLSHPPEAIPSLLEPIIEGTHDFAIGSRYTDGGNVQDWPLSRRIISFGATLLARPLVRVSDPMSGFFALRRKVFLRGEKINATGFKIALELMVKCSVKRIAEAPITFTDRVKGVSKLKLKTQVQYLLQVLSLYFFVYPMLSIGFVAAVLGALGALARYIAIQRRWIRRHPDGRSGLLVSDRRRPFF